MVIRQGSFLMRKHEIDGKITFGKKYVVEHIFKGNLKVTFGSKSYINAIIMGDSGIKFHVTLNKDHTLKTKSWLGADTEEEMDTVWEQYLIKSKRISAPKILEVW